MTRLVEARAKLNKAIEIYAPMSVRTAAINALNTAVAEFEAAVRDDALGIVPPAEPVSLEETRNAINSLDDGAPPAPAEPDVNVGDGTPVESAREVGDAPPVPAGEGFYDPSTSPVAAAEELKPAKGRKKQ